MTTQEIFDKVWAHAQRATKPAMLDGCCMYLTTTGNKCFIGALIPDGHPGQQYAGIVTKLVDAFPDLPFTSWVKEDILRAGDLQICHDGNVCSIDFRTNCLLSLRAWASKYGAVVPE